MKTSHTDGPWTSNTKGEIYSPEGDIVATVYDNPGEEEAESNIELITAAPATELVLRMLLAGVARIKRSPHCDLVEFCFDGMRYMSAIFWARSGWDKARAAVAKAASEGRTP